MACPLLCVLVPPHKQTTKTDRLLGVGNSNKQDLKEEDVYYLEKGNNVTQYQGEQHNLNENLLCVKEDEKYYTWAGMMYTT